MKLALSLISAGSSILVGAPQLGFGMTATIIVAAFFLAPGILGLALESLSVPYEGSDF